MNFRTQTFFQTFASLFKPEFENSYSNINVKCLNIENAPESRGCDFRLQDTNILVKYKLRISTIDEDFRHKNKQLNFINNIFDLSYLILIPLSLLKPFA